MKFSVNYSKKNLEVTITKKVSWEGTVKDLYYSALDGLAFSHVPTTKEKCEIMQMVNDEIMEEDWNECPDYVEAAKRAVEQYVDENQFDWK